MKYIKRHKEYLLERKEEDAWMDVPNWLVYDKEYKVIDFNLPFKKAQKVAIDNDEKGMYQMTKQNNRIFNNHTEAQKAVDEYIKPKPKKKKAKTYTKEDALNDIFYYSKEKDINSFLFAYCVGKILKYEKFLFISKVEGSDDKKDVKEVVIKLSSEKYANKDGFLTKTELMKIYDLSKWTFNDKTFENDLSFLKSFSENKTQHKEELTKVVNEFKEKINKK